jgi:hypothetical protein
MFVVAGAAVARGASPAHTNTHTEDGNEAAL